MGNILNVEIVLLNEFKMILATSNKKRVKQYTKVDDFFKDMDKNPLINYYKVLYNDHIDYVSLR